ncbi:MAG: acetate kinase [Oscillospiraceae bacterium]|nr:acetate kinase [Oscillospiraceae bacterium]
MNILVINAGSSSLKYQLFDMDTESILAKGVCDRIGIDGHLKHTPVSGGKPVYDSDVPLPTHAEAINAVIEKLTSSEYGVIADLAEIDAVGHRVVHGGRKFSESVLIDEDVLAAIEECTLLAPLHVPANLTGVDACRKVMPGVPQAAVFDTAFHHTMPDYAYTYPIPYKYYEENDIKRYGFHGTSHRYVSARAIELLGAGAQGTKIVTCHLGNGSSLAAVKDGKCIDTTMGVTPLEGVPMGTRSGTVDPTLLDLISTIEGGITLRESLDILNKKSGVLGVSGVSSDFRDIEAAKLGGNDRARLALDLFNYQVAKHIGSFIAVMGGADALVFTAGIGENSPNTRKGICSFLGGAGIAIDESKNDVKGEYAEITGAGSSARVFIVPTDEELVIARDTKALVACKA